MLIPCQLFAAGPAPVNLRSTASFVILSGAGITTTGGGIINGDIGASPIAGSAIGVPCAQVNGTIYAVDASGPPCAVIAAGLLTTAKGDLTTAYNDAAGRTPVPTGPNLNPGLIPGSGNIGGMNLAPGLYKFTVTAMITGADVTLTGGPDDVWIFQCAQDLQLGSGISVILAGGAQAKNIFWQVGTSAVLGTFSVFKGTILADQAITMNTSSTIEGRALASTAGVVFNGTGAGSPVAPQIAIQQPIGTNLIDGASTNDFGSVNIGSNTNLTFTITNTGDANLMGLGVTIDGADGEQFTVTANPASSVVPSGSTTFTVQFSPVTAGLKTAALHIASNDNEENPFDIVITGTGTATTAPEMAVEQPPGTSLIDGVSSTDFGTVNPGDNTSLDFTITNTGTADLAILGFSIGGSDLDSFNLTVTPFGPISPNGSATFTVQFAPASLGLKTAVLQIENNDSDENPFEITLTGTGGSTVAAPEIAVQQPPGTDLVDGVSTKDFGSVLVSANTSLTFTITNLGTANLTGLGITIDGADAAQFTVTANPVAPVVANGSTTFTVQFTPASAGVKNAALHITSNDGDENPFDIILAGTGTTVAAPEIAVEQPAGTSLVDGVSSKDFGSVLVSANNSLTFTITNLGTANLTGLGITIDGADAAQFTVTANPVAPVAPSGSTTFTVQFTPASAGVKTAALHIASNDGDENPFDIVITGTGTGTVTTAPEMAVEQPPGTSLIDGVSSTDFGTVNPGDNTSLDFTITNTGTADLAILGFSLGGSDLDSFNLTVTPFGPISPNGSATFTVQFAPASLGFKTAVLQIENNDADENPFEITLTGTGGSTVAAPEIAVQQPSGTDLVDGVSSKDFGSVLVSANTSLTFTITNLGTANLTGLGITIDGADAAQFTVTANPVAPVVPNGSTTFTVQFTPASAGLKTAALHIASNDGNENPFDITITGTGTAVAVTEIAVEQPLGTDLVDGVSSRNFGSVVVSTDSSLTFTIRNLGSANLTGLGITIDGADAAQFSVTANPTAPVAPGGSTTFTVRFTPTSAGVKNAALHIASNDGNENPFDIALTGTGTTTTAPEIAVELPNGTNLVNNVNNTDFGSVVVGNNTSLTFTIRNLGGANLTGLGITINGTDAAQFTVTANPTAPVAPNGSTTFTVRFAPVSAGVKSAGLLIANNDSDENPFYFTLTGTGFDGGSGVTTNVAITATSAITLNPQTGLFEQTVRLTNTGTNSVNGIRLLILTLPSDVVVYNASGSTNGTPFVQYDLPLSTGASVDLLIEYYRANRQNIPQPAFAVDVAQQVSVTETGPVIAINYFTNDVSGQRFLIEFSSTPGARYAVQYSSDGENWKTANPTITAPANRVQWYDDGPPKTESKPSTIGSRFYRVMVLP